MAGGMPDPLVYAQPAQPSGPPDMTHRFNTPLTPEEFPRYQAWAQANPRLGSTFDYDAQGFWKSGGAAAANGHGSDQWKKPNHPTFSDQSQYHGAEGRYFGGSWAPHPAGGWSYAPSSTNLQMHPPGQTYDYFNRVEPDVQLAIPPTAFGMR